MAAVRRFCPGTRPTNDISIELEIITRLVMPLKNITVDLPLRCSFEVDVAMAVDGWKAKHVQMQLQT